MTPAIVRDRLVDEPRRGRRRQPVAVAVVEVKRERLARRLALAHWVERAIDEGRLASYADAARVLGVTRARLSQVMDSLAWSVTDQESVLAYAGGSCRAGGKW